MERDIINRAIDRLIDARIRLLDVKNDEVYRKSLINVDTLTYQFFDANGNETEYLNFLDDNSLFELNEREESKQLAIEDYTLKPIDETITILDNAINSLRYSLNNEDHGLNSVDYKMNQIISTNNEEERNKIIDELSKKISSDLDEFAQVILQYKQQESELTTEKRNVEDANRAILDAIETKKRQINSIRQKRLLLDRILYDYCANNDQSNLRNSNYYISFGKQRTIFALTPTYINQIVNEIRDQANLPDWINLELKVNQNAAREAMKRGEMLDDVVIKTPIYSRIKAIDTAE